jgi:hypothetical protein
MKDHLPDSVQNFHGFPTLDLPKIKWDSMMWLTVIPFLLSFLPFVFPKLLTDLSLTKLKFIIVIPLFLAPLLVPLTCWILKTIIVINRRARIYPSLYLHSQNTSLEIEQLRKSYYDFTNTINKEKEFEIIKVGHEKNKLLIVVRKRKSPKIAKNDLLNVLHKKDGLLMGIFQVVEIKSKEFYAIGIRNIDPVWLGFVLQEGEVNINPYLAAVLFNKGERIS